MLNKRTGAALLLVLIVMLIIAIGCGAMLKAIISYSNMKIVSIKNIKAQYWAEAGMIRAFEVLRNEGVGAPLGSINIPADGYAVTITKEGPDSNGIYTIIVAARESS
jgi:Tfp pilus assembly protein PilX